MAVLDLLPTEFARQLRTGRDLVAERRRTPDDERLATACPPLDAVLDGGIERGTLVELVGWGSSGRFSLVLATLAAVTARGEAAALVDLGDGLDPRTAAAAGVELERLLWVRPKHMKEALASAEILLELGLPLLAIDLGVPPVPGGRGVEAFWLRLARAAQRQRTALLIASPYRVSGTAAQRVVEVRDRRGVWQGRGHEPKLLAGVTSNLDLIKGTGWHQQGPSPLELEIAPPPVVPPKADPKDKAKDKTKGAIEGAVKGVTQKDPKKTPKKTVEALTAKGSPNTAKGSPNTAKGSPKLRPKKGLRLASPPPVDPLLRPRTAIA